jgi:hypothetical protein
MPGTRFPYVTDFRFFAFSGGVKRAFEGVSYLNGINGLSEHFSSNQVQKRVSCAILLGTSKILASENLNHDFSDVLQLSDVVGVWMFS